VIFVPASCAGVIQPCDVGLQHFYKNHNCLAATKYIIELVQTQINTAIPPNEVKLSILLPPFGNASAEWVVH
ncbi:hypothetical protein BDD12DRAFT_751668, partial [Trichophaea hybrida]